MPSKSRFMRELQTARGRQNVLRDQASVKYRLTLTTFQAVHNWFDATGTPKGGLPDPVFIVPCKVHCGMENIDQEGRWMCGSSATAPPQQAVPVPFFCATQAGIRYHRTSGCSKPFLPCRLCYPNGQIQTGLAKMPDGQRRFSFAGSRSWLARRHQWMACLHHQLLICQCLWLMCQWRPRLRHNRLCQYRFLSATSSVAASVASASSTQTRLHGASLVMSKCGLPSYE